MNYRRVGHGMALKFMQVEETALLMFGTSEY